MADRPPIRVDHNRFVRRPGSKIVECKNCSTHISEELALMYVVDPENRIGFFEFTINLRPGRLWISETNNELMNKHCAGCGELLGSTFVRVQEPSSLVREGITLLFLPKLQVQTADGILEATALTPPHD